MSLFSFEFFFIVERYRHWHCRRHRQRRRHHIITTYATTNDLIYSKCANWMNSMDFFLLKIFFPIYFKHRNFKKNRKANNRNSQKRQYCRQDDECTISECLYINLSNRRWHPIAWVNLALINVNIIAFVWCVRTCVHASVFRLCLTIVPKENN